MRKEEKLDVIERVIDGGVRIFRARAVLVNMDASDGRGRDVPVLEVPEQAVPVFSSEGELIGHCSVGIERRQVVADIAIDYSTPERLHVEADCKLWAHPVGLYVVEGEDGQREFRDLSGLSERRPVGPVESVTVTSVYLGITPPRDPRIPPVSESPL